MPNTNTVDIIQYLGKPRTCNPYATILHGKIRNLKKIHSTENPWIYGVIYAFKA